MASDGGFVSCPTVLQGFVTQVDEEISASTEGFGKAL